MGPVHARDNGQGVSGAEPVRIARYQDLLYARTGKDVTALIGIGLGLMVQPAGRGVGVPVHPTEAPGGL